MGIEEREQCRRDLLLCFARIEAALLGQRRTPEVVRTLANLQRSRDQVVGLGPAHP